MYRNLLVACAAASLTGFANSQLARLTTDSGGGERQPVVSADGRYVAYFGVVNGSREVFRIATDGGSKTQLTTGAHAWLGYGTFEAWPSLSISGNGRWITYWNSKGVQVIDAIAKTSRVLSATYQIPYPHVDAAGRQVVYQSPVNNAQEVFLVPVSGGNARQLTTASGVGRRLPHVHGNLVVFQKQVQGYMEVFAYDLTNNTSKQLSQNSGPGNRYARIAPGGKSVVYEAVTRGCKEVWRVDPVSGTRKQLTSIGSLGNRLAATSGDEEIFFQGRDQAMEIRRADHDGKGIVVLTKNSESGLRRPSTDEHGHVVVFQARGNALTNEVWRMRLCPATTLSAYGKHGKPSRGTLASTVDWYRCRLDTGLQTSLPNAIGVYLLGAQRIDLAIPNAPGNSLYVTPLALFATAANASGRFDFSLPTDTSLTGTTYYQWVVLDAAANQAGIVSSEGRLIQF